MAHIVMAYLVMAHIVMAYLVTAYIVMAYLVMALYSYGLFSYGSTVASVVGMHGINVLFMIGGMVLVKSDADYVEWPAKLALGADW